MSFIKASLLLLAASATHGDAKVVQPRQSVPDGYVAVSTYPSPHGGWDPDWRESYIRAKAIVDRMTLAEKTNITSGSGWWMGRCVGNTGSAERVGFPQLCLCDSATGLNSVDNVTAFPPGITTGATWDKTLMYERGVAMGKEFRGKGANIWLGPSVGPLGRKPRGGRNWEGFGSDPVLQGKAAALSIKGVQEQGVIATIKHLIGNEQEMFRMYNPLQQGLSANIDDRTLHELYLWPFADGIRAGSGAVMTAYNAVNGTASVQHSYLINGILKNELGFQGLTMSDWFSHMPSGIQNCIGGLDLNMPGDTQIPLFGYSYWMYDLTRSVLNGSVPMDRLNDMATRIVATWLKFGQDEGFPKTNFHVMTYDREADLYPAAWPFSPRGVVNEFVQVQDDHHLVARQVAQDAITMLKNNGSLLPIAESSRIRVFGTAAQTNPDGPNACAFRSCNKGVLGMGWGSGVVDYMYIDDPISAIRRRADNVEYYATDRFPSVPAPADDDVAIVFITSASGENSFTVEGNAGDRNSAGLRAWHDGDRLVRDAAARYKNVIVVVQTVGPILVEEWIDLPSVKGLLFQHLPGQEAGDSLTNVLFGDVSPSGHLPYSITRRESDLPDSVTKLTGGSLGQPQDTFSEGLYIDYRYLNKNGVKPRFAFGSGLSYTSFSFGDARILSVNELTSRPPTPPPRPAAINFDQPIPPCHCQCVLADGVERGVLTSNRMIPGPSIQVCENDKVVIDVENHMEGMEVTIHWHGIHQRGSQYYDGVPFVTQCPIQQGNTFRYQWTGNAGTHFWHSHTGLQKLDGLYGSVVVRQPPSRDPNSHLYDFDLTTHIVLISDWLHEDAAERYPGRLAVNTGQDPENVLINGKGQFRDPNTGFMTNTPLEIFTVTPGRRYRFRMINAFASVCPAQITIEGHSMTVIATDGEPVHPVEVNTIISFSGERYDFVINADQQVGAYWIQLRGLGECGIRRAQQLAILRYARGPYQPSSPAPTYDVGIPQGVVMNPLDAQCNRQRDDAICVSQLKSAKDIDRGILQEKPDVKIFLPFRFYLYRPEELFMPNTYNRYLVAPTGDHVISLIDEISYLSPPAPLTSQYNEINPEQFCNGDNRPADCGPNCMCTHKIDIPLNAIVEVVLVDEVQQPNLSHPFHLHGYGYSVVGIGRSPDSNVKKINLKHALDLDRRGLLHRQYNLPPTKDTIAVPNNGYVVLRFRADNPGFWLFHCHFLFHIVIGMNLILQVGNQADLPPVPPGFPTCGDHTPQIPIN